MIFSRFTHPCVTIGVLAELWIEEVVNVIIGTLSSADVDRKIDVMSDNDVGVLAGVSATVLTLLMPSL